MFQPMLPWLLEPRRPKRLPLWKLLTQPWPLIRPKLRRQGTLHRRLRRNPHTSPSVVGGMSTASLEDSVPSPPRLRRRRPHRPRRTPPTTARPARLRDRQRGGSERLFDQPGRPRGISRIRRHAPQLISIGRRLQDPLAELVKIEPQNIGVGLYQHDVNPKQLKETLESVISSCVNFVGVDLNTASVPLLRHVSGLNQLTARRIVDHRKEKGPFTDRDQLMQVEGVGPATFTQAAGLPEDPRGRPPLDRTWVHPESYEAATSLLEKLGFAPEIVHDKDRFPNSPQLDEADVAELAKELEVGDFTLRDIIEALGRPERDPRDDLPKPIFKKGMLKLEDLSPGMELKGTVLNVVDFGAFVDIGLKDSGLVHISQLANRYIKSPHDVVSVGDVVNVWVMGVDQERKRVSLTMVKPGTERQRGAGGQKRGQGPRRTARRPGCGRAGASRPRSASQWIGLDVASGGAAPVTALLEPPARRPDRDRGGPPGQHGLPGGGDGGAHGQTGSGPGPGGGRFGPGQRPAPGRGGPRFGPSGQGHGPGPGRSGPGRQQERFQPRAGPPGLHDLALPPSTVQGGSHGQRPPAYLRPAQATMGAPANRLAKKILLRNPAPPRRPPPDLSPLAETRQAEQATEQESSPPPVDPGKQSAEES